MKVCVLCYGLRKDNVRLQPWRYILEISAGLKRNNIDVAIITNGTEMEQAIEGIRIINVEKLRSAPLTRNETLINKLKSENPDVILWSIGPLDYLYKSTFNQLEIPIVGLITGPIYRLSDISRIGVKDVVSNFRMLSAHILYAALPRFFLRNLLNSASFKKIFVMSRKNKKILVSYHINDGKIVHVPVGVDAFDLSDPVDNGSIVSKYNLDQDAFNVLYLGSPASIRGIDTAIKAVSVAKNDIHNLKLLILSRRNDSELSQEEKAARDLIVKLGVEKKVQIISGFLSKDDVKRFIHYSNIVVLPFKIVPADMPTSILEAMALGKVIISTDVDGIPELLEDGRGVVVAPNDYAGLSKKILECYRNQPEMQSMAWRCRRFMQTYPQWDTVSKLVAEELSVIQRT